MRDSTKQLTRLEQVGVWTFTVHPVRYIVLFVATLPLVPIMGSFEHGPHEMWIIGPIVLATTPYFLDRTYRTDLTPTDTRRVLESQLTGWSTGDSRLDGWVLHRATPAAERRRKHPWEDWVAVGLTAVTLLALSVTASILVSPWWLLCLAAVPLFLALPIARAQSDPASVVDLLSVATPSDDRLPVSDAQYPAMPFDDL